MMKTSWYILILLIWVSCAGAQIVLEPCVTGTTRYSKHSFYWKGYIWTATWSTTNTYTSYYTYYYNTCFEPRVVMGYDARHYYTRGRSSFRSHDYLTIWKGVIEFYLNSIYGGKRLPTSNMTPYNWTAKIDNLVIKNPRNVGDFMPTQMFDLEDIGEDGDINQDDYDSNFEYITTLFEHIPAAGTTYNNIDITNALRRDLFGEGSGDFTSGFIFSVTGAGSVAFNHQLPRVSINLATPTPSPTITPIVTSTPTTTPTPDPWSG
ncbi:hypothetical protein K8T06_14945, partial [bacterium]|nr:hypothetical protein [bacterium]